MPVNVRTYYDDHPITAETVLAAVARVPGRNARLTAEDLFPFDQDHYGGLAAVSGLVTRAGVRPGARVLDVCAGLAGPARFLATRFGCRVVALELHPARARGAARLTAAVGLAGAVRVVRGDAQALPFAPARFDACVSQEGLLHVPDKAAVLTGCRRVLVPGARLAFTDWIAGARLEGRERERLQAWMAATTLQTLEGYRTLLGRAGFRHIDVDDVSEEWRTVMRDRLDRHRAIARSVPAEAHHRYDALLDAESAFADLLAAGKLGGGRFTATA